MDKTRLELGNEKSFSMLNNFRLKMHLLEARYLIHVVQLHCKLTAYSASLLDGSLRQ